MQLPIDSVTVRMGAVFFSALHSTAAEGPKGEPLRPHTQADHREQPAAMQQAGGIRESYPTDKELQGGLEQ